MDDADGRIEATPLRRETHAEVPGDATRLDPPHLVTLLGVDGKPLAVDQKEVARAARRRRPLLPVREIVAPCLGVEPHLCACIWVAQTRILRLAIECWAERARVGAPLRESEWDDAPRGARIAGRAVDGPIAVVCVRTDADGVGRELRPLHWTDVMTLAAGSADRTAQALLLHRAVQDIVTMSSVPASRIAEFARQP